MNKNLFYLLTLLFFLGACSKSENTSISSGTQTGSLASFNTIGNYLLLADGNSLHAYDISQPSTPIIADTYTDEGNIIETVFVLDDQIFLGTTNAMLIMDISTSGELILKGRAQHIRSCDPVVVRDTIAYVTTRATGPCGGLDLLIAYNVTDIENPVEVFSTTLEDPLGLATHEDILYVCELNKGISVFSLEEPWSPSYIRTIEATLPKDIIILNSAQMMVLNEEYLSFYDISNPEEPTFKFKYE